MNNSAEKIVTDVEFAKGDINFIMEKLTGLAGGIMKIHNQHGDKNCLRLGLIESAVIEDNELRVEFVWLTRGDGYLSLPLIWTREKNLSYAAEMERYVISGTDNSKLVLNFLITGDTVTLFSSDNDKSDHAKTENLEFTHPVP